MTRALMTPQHAVAAYSINCALFEQAEPMLVLHGVEQGRTEIHQIVVPPGHGSERVVPVLDLTLASFPLAQVVLSAEGIAIGPFGAADAITVYSASTEGAWHAVAPFERTGMGIRWLGEAELNTGGQLLTGDPVIKALNRIIERSRS